MDSSSLKCSAASGMHSSLWAITLFPTNPVIPIASERLSPACSHSSRSSSYPVSAPLPPTRNAARAQYGSWGDAHRQSIGRGLRHAVGGIARLGPACVCGSDVAVDRPRPCPHVPAVCGTQIACRFHVFGDQRGIRIRGIRIAPFDLGGQLRVQGGAIGLELRFVGNRADQRMPKDVLRLRRELDLVDELGLDQLARRAVSPTSVAGSSPSNCEPITDAAFRVRFATASNRSMRAAMAACNVAGTVASAAVPSDR